MALADWIRAQQQDGGSGGSQWNPLGGITTLGRTIANKVGNPMDWGKNPIDPNQATLQDGAYLRDYIKDRLGGLDQRQAPMAGNAARMTAARIDPAQQAQFRAQQMALAQQLAGVASGQQMGAGELATRRQFGQGAAQQLGMIAAQRGGMAGLAGRAGARALGDMSINAAGQSGMAALQDQGAARGLLAGVLGQGREQDLGLATNQAGLNQQAGLANAQALNQFKLADQAAKLQQMGMNDQAIAQMLGQLYGISAAEMAAKLGILQGNQQDTGYLGDLMQMGGTLGAAYLGRPAG